MAMMTKDEDAQAHVLEVLLGSSQRAARRWRLLLGVLIVLVWVLTVANFARAGFTTIINSPPTEFYHYGTIESNTQVNLYYGGVLPGGYNIGPAWYPGDNIEVNLLGGTVGEEGDYWGGLITESWWARTTNVTFNLIEGTVWGGVQASDGALVTLRNANVNGDLGVRDSSLLEMTGGEITGGLRVGGGSMARMSGGTANADTRGLYQGTAVYEGSVFLLSGGTIGGYFSVDDSYARVTGGRIEGEVPINANGLLEVAGGTFGHVTTSRGGSLSLSGGEFQLDGVPVEGINTFSQSFEFPADSVLTGVLADGTPVTLSNIQYRHDYFDDGKITLQSALVPAAEPRHFNVPNEVAPAGLRGGQSLMLGPGGATPVNFAALPGSTITIDGGRIDSGFEASGASITMTAGSIGADGAIYHGTTMQMLGGEIGSDFAAGPGSRLEVKGGKVNYSLLARPESEVIYSGGKMGEGLNMNPGSSFTVAGGEFRINGTPVTGLTKTGTVRQIDLPEHGVLSGTLEDGTPFALSASEGVFAPGTLRLHAAEIPAPGPMVLRVPSDAAPQGLRSGQTLFLADGGVIGEYFTAGWGSTMRMTGGRIGDGFQTVGSFVNVSGGEIESLKALFGSVVNISGGTVNYQVRSLKGSIVNLSGGMVGEGIYAYDDGRVNMSGGTVDGFVYVSNQSSMNISGGAVTRGITLIGPSSLTVAGGNINGIAAHYDSQVELRGGRIGDETYVAQQARATLRGSDFRVDGVPLAADDSLGWYGMLDLPQGTVLSGVFADGTPFAFTSDEGDWFAPGTLKVMSSPLEYLGGDVTPILIPPVPLAGLQPGETLTLKTGHDVGTNFTAGWDSTLTIDGGAVGDNFEAVGATINLLAGSIGNEMDTLFGTEFNMMGGTVGRSFEAHRGSVVNISGGSLEELTAGQGSVVNITGGTLGGYADTDSVVFSLIAGSTLHITGSDFLLGGELIEGLAPGSSIVLDWNNLAYSSYLTGRLADGSPFDAYLHDEGGSMGLRTIVLTSVAASLQVPEPAGVMLLMIATGICVGGRQRESIDVPGVARYSRNRSQYFRTERIRPVGL
jgi:hypothetical protein